MKHLAILTSLSLVLAPWPAFAHWGHVGELAGHGHAIAIGAAAAAAALAAWIAAQREDETSDEADDEAETA